MTGIGEVDFGESCRMGIAMLDRRVDPRQAGSTMVGTRRHLRRRVLQCHPQLRRQGLRALCVVNFTIGPASSC